MTKKKPLLALARAEVGLFEKLKGQFDALYQELSTLAKKSPDGSVNTFKLALVNEKLRAANTLLTGEHRPFEQFEVFDEQSLPTSSDVAMVLGQYLSCMEGWRSEQMVFEAGNWLWNTVDGPKLTGSRPTRSKKG